eukprot:2675269-Prymnesium_polylepis.1
MAMLSDDVFAPFLCVCFADDDGIPDFGFQDVKEDEDWQRSFFNDAWSLGGNGNPLGIVNTAGGVVRDGSPVGADGEPAWMRNIQYQITLSPEQDTR